LARNDNKQRCGGGLGRLIEFKTCQKKSHWVARNALKLRHLSSAAAWQTLERVGVKKKPMAQVLAKKLRLSQTLQRQKCQKKKKNRSA